MPVDNENGSPPYIVNPVSGNKHSQTRALRIMARNQGWDPDVIVGTTSPEGVVKPSVNISNFNKDPDSFWHRGVGELPEGIQGKKESYPQAEEPRYASPFEDWNAPEYGRETKDNSTSGDDPFSGMGGM